LFEKALGMKNSFNKIYWGLKLEAENNDNPPNVCAHFEHINKELMEEAEDKKPDFHETILGAVGFRKKYMDLSNYLLKKTKKATEM